MCDGNPLDELVSCVCRETVVVVVECEDKDEAGSGIRAGNM